MVGPLRWVFLDIGNVVMNDDPAMAFLYRTLVEELAARGIEKPLDELLAEREDLVRTRGTGHWSILTERYLGASGLADLRRRSSDAFRSNYFAFHNVIPGMPEVIESIGRRFALGVVANQMREAEAALEHAELRRHFRFLALSEVVGASKPDPALFLHALEQAGCQPEEAVMVGDRVDNDVAPARALGLKAIWFHLPLPQKGYTPSDDLARRYYESQGRASVAERPPAGPDETPDLEVRAATDLLPALLRLGGAA